MLSSLPPEITAQIIQHLPSAQALHHVSSTCHTLHDVVEEHGWQSFVHDKFPSLVTPCIDWKSAARSLTTLSRNWDRKAVVARIIRPEVNILNLNTIQREQQWNPPTGQTIGSQTLVDGFEELVGNSWVQRNEVLAFTAGAEIEVRIKLKDQKARFEHKHVPNRKAFEENADSPGYAHWARFKPTRARHGPDDITALKVLRTADVSNRLSSGTLKRVPVIIGTANGQLKLRHLPVSLDDYDKRAIDGTTFDTLGRGVRSLDTARQQNTLLVAAIGDRNLSLYDYGSSSTTVSPLDDLNICKRDLEDKSQKRIYSTKWLGSSRIAVGISRSEMNLHVYQVRPDKITVDPIREFHHDWAEGSADLLSQSEVQPASCNTVKAVTLLPIESQAGHVEGDVFLSGGSDDLVKLHDLRSPRNYEHIYGSLIYNGGVSSLQTFGRERIAVGHSQQSVVKIFDLRVSGGRMYDYRSNLGSSSTVVSAGSTKPFPGRDAGWSLFLFGPHCNLGTRRGATPARQRGQRSANSSVYSLCSPSNTSPTLYAGLEARVVQIDLTSSTDGHPDPLLAKDAFTSGSGCRNERDHEYCVLSLRMYAHGRGGRLNRLRTQAPIGNEMAGHENLPGLDARWINIEA